MARKTPTETNAAAQRRLTEAMLSLGHSIDKQGTGPKRLQMLRDQASLSDKRESAAFDPDVNEPCRVAVVIRWAGAIALQW